MIDSVMDKADMKRIGDKAEATVAQSDEQRMLAGRRERELDRLAGDLPDDPKALWMYAEHSMAQAAVSFIDTGRALIKLKEQLPHGEFRSGLEYRGIPKSTANDMMRVARKMSWRSDKFIKLGRTKLYACMELDDDEIDALEDGGSILDITLDDMDRMTTRELKDALKKSRADSDVKDRLLQSKNKQIDDVAEENARLHGHVSEQGVSAFIQEIESEKAQILIPLMRLKNRSLAMEQQLNSEGAVDRAEYFALQAALDCVRDELAQAMDAIYNAGAEFQASVSQASMPSESGNIQ